jgi:hypothetical protein
MFYVFVLSCVLVEALRQADRSPKESYRLCKNNYGTAGEGLGREWAGRAMEKKNYILMGQLNGAVQRLQLR